MPAFLHQASLLGVGALAVRVLPLVLLLTVLLDGEPADYGAYSLALSIAAIGYTIAEGGISIYVTTNAAITNEVEGAVRRLSWVVGGLAYAGVVVTGAAFALRDGFDFLRLAIAPLGLTVLVAGPSASATARLIRLGRAEMVAKVQVVGGAVGVFGGFLAFALGLGIWALVVQATVVPLTVAVGVLAAPEARITCGRGLRPAAGVLRDLRSALASNLMGAVGRRADDLMLGLVAGPYALGLYSAGYRILLVGTELLLHPAERVNQAAVGSARRVGGASGAFSIGLGNQRRVATYAPAAFAVAGLGAFLLIPRVLGEAWAPAATVAILLCAAGAVYSTFSLTYSTVFATKSADAALRYQACLVPLMLVPTLIGVFAGAVGAAFGYLVGNVLAFWYSRSVQRRAQRQALDLPVIEVPLGSE